MLRRAELYERATAAAANAKVLCWQDMISNEHETGPLHMLLGDATLKLHTAEAVLQRPSRGTSRRAAVQTTRVEASSTDRESTDAKVCYTRIVKYMVALT
jgi:hypothetical protein